MNLKKIEAYGFKSFADKLTLNFNSGVTCIVGPNGCGKSNVSDAIRWVLGEQSPKNLRGKSMQEVIFNGTANRKAMGYCEVSLFFDNTERTYEVDADEVIIKRKLFRSGDSEYYINNEQCRLKDILDLFRDTGIGKDGYSVVGQGKIDSFLSAKPEDRRQIFEEAAFGRCSSLTSITFAGTIAQWNAIEKYVRDDSRDWDSEAGEYTVHCSDGDISK